VLTSPRGFTLIELLVVLVIVGIVLGMASVQLMPDARATLRQEAVRLALLLENAHQESLVSGHDLAWRGQGSRYAFLARDEYNEWKIIEDSSPYRPRDLPDNIAVQQVMVENQALPAEDLLAFGARGLPLRFQIELGNQVGSLYLAGNSTGAVTVSQTPALGSVP
jgi:type II secretion system protein H